MSVKERCCWSARERPPAKTPEDPNHGRRVSARIPASPFLFLLGGQDRRRFFSVRFPPSLPADRERGSARHSLLFSFPVFHVRRCRSLECQRSDRAPPVAGTTWLMRSRRPRRLLQRGPTQSRAGKSMTAR